MRILGIISLVVSIAAAPPALASGALVIGKDRGGYWTGNIVVNKRTIESAVAEGMKICSDHAFHACEVKERFSRQCAAVAYSRTGAISWATGGRADETQRRVIEHCNRRYGGGCKSGPVECDNVAPRTFVCLDPIFEERQKLLERVEKDLSYERFAYEAVRYLEAKYCGYAPEKPAEDSPREFYNSHCYAASGMFRGERVYWQDCDSYE